MSTECDREVIQIYCCSHNEQCYQKRLLLHLLEECGEQGVHNCDFRHRLNWLQLVILKTLSSDR